MATDCFVVNVVKDAESVLEYGELPVVSAADFLAITVECSEQIAEINQQAVVVCGKCRSFQVPSLALFRVSEKVERLARWADEPEEADGLSLLKDLLDSIVSNIVVDIEVNDADWISFLNTGLPRFEPLYDSDGEVVYSWDGAPRKLEYSYVVFKFGEKCSDCNRLYLAEA